MEKDELIPSPQVKHFDWEKAKVFYFVAKCGSFAAAARFLNSSQPSLSRQISSLEQQVGFPLFSRHSGGVCLTRKGKELFHIVENAYDEFKNFTHQNGYERKSTEGIKKKIRIAATHAVHSYILEEHIHKYNLMNPDLVFELIADNHLVDIELQDVDIAIRPKVSPVQNISWGKAVQEDFLFGLERRLYASKSYLETYGEPIKVRDLKNHRLIGHSHPEAHPYADVNWILRLGLPEGELHEPVLLSNSIECGISAAKKGFGIVGSFAEYTVIQESGLRNILPETKDTIIDTFFIYPNYLKHDKDILELKNHLRKCLSKPTAQ